MNNEPNREQELTEKELKGIVGGASGPCELSVQQIPTTVKVEEPADTIAARRFEASGL